MKRKCWVPGCNRIVGLQDDGTTISMHGFPGDVTVRKKWKDWMACQAVNTFCVLPADFDTQTAAAICSKHFTKEDYNRSDYNTKKQKLLRSAVPSIPAQINNTNSGKRSHKPVVTDKVLEAALNSIKSKFTPLALELGHKNAVIKENNEIIRTLREELTKTQETLNNHMHNDVQKQVNILLKNVTDPTAMYIVEQIRNYKPPNEMNGVNPIIPVDPTSNYHGQASQIPPYNNMSMVQTPLNDVSGLSYSYPDQFR